MNIAAYFAQRELDQHRLATAAQHTRPTVFELMACEQLQASVRPALRYALSVFVERHPTRHWVRLYNSFDELYAVAVAVVEWHYWRAWNATFTESFYGIKRVSPRHLVSVTRRSRRHETLVHLLAVVGVPYVAQKVDALYDRLTGGRAARAFQAAADPTDGETESDSAVRALDTGEDAHTREETDITPRANDDPPTLRLRLLPPWLLRLAIRSRPRVQKQLKRWFLRLYPYIYMIASLCGWFYRLAFMYENTAYWSPLMHVIGWSYARITPEDYSRNDQPPYIAPGTPLPLALVKRVAHMTLSALKTAIPSAIMFLKFLEWWYTAGRARTQREDDLMERDAIPPPESLKPRMKLPVSPRKCPLCRRERRNACYLTLSGYVFCYPCIFAHLEKEAQCPVTHVPVPPSLAAEGPAALLCKIYDAEDER